MKPDLLSFLLIACLVVSGCTAADNDGDLLPDAFEQAIGTNYQIMDSDGDGFPDAMEYLAYFNPQDKDDYPWQGGYQRLASPGNFPDENHPDANPINGGGWGEGDISQDWSAEDQFHDLFDLHDFYGQAILIAVGTADMTQQAAARADFFNDFGADGLIIIDILVDDIPPDPGVWAATNDITHIVLEDSAQEIIDHYVVVEEGSFNIPNFTTIGRDMEIKAHYRTGAPDFDLLQDLLDEQPPDVVWPLPGNVAAAREELGITVTAPEPHLQANIDRGAAMGGGSSSGGGGEPGSVSDGGYVNPNRSDGSYAGPPFGGDNCSSAGASSAGLPALLFGLVALLVRRRS